MDEWVFFRTNLSEHLYSSLFCEEATQRAAPVEQQKKVFTPTWGGWVGVTTIIKYADGILGSFSQEETETPAPDEILLMNNQLHILAR